MERMEGMIAQIAAAKRDELIASDTGTDPALRRDRAEVSPGCRLKHGDDVMVSGMQSRVICPSEVEGWFYDLSIEGMIFVVGQHEAQYVTDRAPADPEEEPMPIFPEPEPEPPPP